LPSTVLTWPRSNWSKPEWCVSGLMRPAGNDVHRRAADGCAPHERQRQ
jgi:hypothetical protein